MFVLLDLAQIGLWLLYITLPILAIYFAYIILTKPSREYTGNFFIDDEVLIQNGITDLSKYSVVPNATLLPDFFLYGGGQT